MNTGNSPDDESPGLAIDCNQVVGLVTDYLEGAVSSQLRSQIDAHLALCRGCEVYLQQMRQTIDSLGYVPVESLSEQAITELVTAFRNFNSTA